MNWINTSDKLPKENSKVIAFDNDSLTPEKELLFKDGKFLYCKYGSELDYTNSISKWRHLTIIDICTECKTPNFCKSNIDKPCVVVK